MNQQAHRKNEHISLAEKFFSNDDSQFQEIQLIHHPLPEIAADEIDPSTTINDGKLKFKWPFYIEAMTGGSQQSYQINKQLSKIAEATGLAMASGSESVALKDSTTADSFQIIRKNLIHSPVIGNLGAGHDYQTAQQAVNLMQADALEIHLNVIQEMIMPEGDRSFYWKEQIKEIQDRLTVPLIIKEVGFGMDNASIKQLKQLGIKNINISGRGGTNFALIENYRRHLQELNELSELGQSTVQSLLEVREYHNQISIIASGGIKSALDIIKSIALGASLVGVAGKILDTLIKGGPEETIHLIKNWQLEITTVMTILGCRTIRDLQKTPFILSTDLINYLNQRHLKI